jgi:hypothetical protein
MLVTEYDVGPGAYGVAVAADGDRPLLVFP